MKIVFYVIGIFISLFASVKVLQYFFSGKALTAYGKGNVLGNGVLLLIGITMIFAARRKSKARSSND